MSTRTSPSPSSPTPPSRGTSSAPASARPAAPQAPGFASSVWLVSEREIRARLRSKAFLISSALLLVIILGSILFAGFSANSAGSEATKVAVVDATSEVIPAAAAKSFDVTVVDDEQAAEKLVRDGDVEATILPDRSGDSPLLFEVVANDSAPTSVVQALSTAPKVVLLDQGADAGFLGYLVAIAFGLVFFSSAMTFGSTIAQSVVEEKQTRVVEILMSAIPVRALLAGKVLGNSILAFAQIALIAVIAIVGLTVTGQSDLLTGLGAPIVWFVIFFVIGFVLLAALFAATAALVSRQEDVGSTTMPVTMLVMLPYFAVIFFNDNPTVLAIMSYIPFSAPVGMPVRLFLGTAEWWEPLLSLAILAVTTVVVLLLGSKMYSNSLLRTGARVKLGEALRG
ncbi:ABC transporter permease [Okibacterium fritillariae]|uniref:ABC transporter permease n=1 Tax=Okibacterium fritillariae TaxID=123320 RepID=UPI0040557E5B